MHSPLIVGMTMALLFSLGTCIIQIQSLWVNLPGQKDFSISWQKQLSVSAMFVCVLGAQYSFWTSNKSLFLVAWPRGLHFWRATKISSWCYWRCVLSWQILFQQRQMRISWWLCNNSEIHLCLWKKWRLVVFSESSFCVTRARKNDRNRRNAFFLSLKKDELGIQQTTIT